MIFLGVFCCVCSRKQEIGKCTNVPVFIWHNCNTDRVANCGEHKHVLHFYLMCIDRSYPLNMSVCGQYMGSIASLPHCYAHCICVCEVWRLWWLSFCLWLVAFSIACFQPSDTRALQNVYVKLMSLQVHCISLWSLFVLVQSLTKKKCEVYCNNVVKLCP